MYTRVLIRFLLLGLVFSHGSSFAQIQAVLPANIESTNREEAFLEAEKALKDVLDGEDTQGVLPALLRAAKAANDLRRLDVAESYAEQALQLARVEEKSLETARALQSLGVTQLYRSNYDEALELFAEALPRLEAGGDARRIAQIHRNIGQAWRYQASYELALEHYGIALEISRDSGDLEGLSETYNSIAVTQARLGAFEQALETHGRSLALSRELGTLDGVASSLYNMGDIYFKLGDFDLSRQYFEDSYALDQKIGNPSDIAHSAQQLGRAWLGLEDLDRATQFVDEAHALFTGIGAERNIAWAESLQGRIALAGGDFDRAEELLNVAFEVARERDQGNLLPSVRSGLAELAMARGQLETARTQIELAIGEARNASELHQVLELLDFKYRLLVTKGDLRNALTTLEDKTDLERSIFDRRRAHVIAELQGRNENMRQAQEIELLRREAELRKERIERHRLERNLLIASIVTILLIFALVLGRIVQARVNRRLSEEVRARTSDLRKANAALEELGWRDPLTGVHNRRYLADRLPPLLRRASSDKTRPGSKERANLTILLLDIDRFKQINDRYGHHAGDEILRQVAAIMEEALRADDLLIRWGGEEFLTIHVGLDRDMGSFVSERLRSAIESHAFVLDQGKEVRITASIGFASFPLLSSRPDAYRFEQVVSIADESLYWAKRAGRNSWCGRIEDNDSLLPEDLPEDPLGLASLRRLHS